MTTRRQGAPCFAAVPFRAIVNLDGLRLRLLGAIAAHDRMGKGQGCRASSKRLADLLDTDPSLVRRYVSGMVTDRYLRRERMVTDKRKWVLRINYDNDADWAAFAPKSVTTRSHRSAEKSVTATSIICDSGSAANPQKRSISGAAHNIDSESVSYTQSRYETPPTSEQIAQSAPSAPSCPQPQSCHDSVNQINSEKSAQASKTEVDGVVILGVRYASTGHYLRAVENTVRRVKDRLDNGQPFTPSEMCFLEAHYWELRSLEDIYETHEGEPLGGWAQRLGSEIDWALHLSNEPASDDD